MAPSEMVGLLSDLHVAESLAEHEARKQEKDGTTLLQGYRNSVLRKRGVSSGLFQKSMEFYRQNPEYLGEIYLEVITELSKKEAVVSASH